MFSKKKVFKKIFQAISKNRSSKLFFRRERSSKKFFFRRFSLEENKKGLRKFFARFLALFNKISTVQKIVLSSSQGQGNFQGLEASKPRPRTSKSVVEAKDVLEDSTSASYHLASKRLNHCLTHKIIKILFPKSANFFF